MKTVCLALLLLGLPPTALARLPALCCRYPIRSFGNTGSVNLAPLFQWWTNSAGNSQSIRPLAAWRRVVGVRTGDLEYQWIVDAKIYTRQTTWRPARIVLLNPPVQQEQLFYSLKAQIAQDELNLTNAQRTYRAELKAEQRDQARARADARSWRRWRRFYSGVYDRQARREQNAARQTQKEKQQTRQALEAAQKALAAIPSSHGQYQIDCFALDTGKTLHGFPVYDVGVTIRTRP